jgi:hypothetical protein
MEKEPGPDVARPVETNNPAQKNSAEKEKIQLR